MASAEGWFCFRNWNVSRLDFYFQFTFQIQLPKLFDLSPCLLTRKRTLGLLSWELGAHVERLAGIHILAKFSHTKGPEREKRKDESPAAATSKAAPPRRALRRRRPPPIKGETRVRGRLFRARPGFRADGGGWRVGGEGPGWGGCFPQIRAHATLRRRRKVLRKGGKECDVRAP